MIEGEGHIAETDTTITIPASMGNEQPDETICCNCKYVDEIDLPNPYCKSTTCKDYVKGGIKILQTYCSMKNTDGKCKDYEAKE